MAKSKKRPTKVKKFRLTLNRGFLGLVAVLLFATVGGVLGLEFISAAGLNINQVIREGDSKSYTMSGKSGKVCFRFQRSKNNTSKVAIGSFSFKGVGKSSGSNTGDTFTSNMSGSVSSPVCTRSSFDAPGGSGTFTVTVNDGSMYLKKITWK